MDKAKEAIVQKLKASGCRITKQRLMLLDIILEENCSCCKEIYYRASRIDPSIGTATVYRIRTVTCRMHVQLNWTMIRSSICLQRTGML